MPDAFVRSADVADSVIAGYLAVLTGTNADAFDNVRTEFFNSVDLFEVFYHRHDAPSLISAAEGAVYLRELKGMHGELRAKLATLIRLLP